MIWYVTKDVFLIIEISTEVTLLAPGGQICPPLQFFGYNSETVKANLAKLSDIIYLAIPLDLSPFGARLHV